MKSHSFFQPAPHAVSFDRVAMFFGDGKSNAGFGVGELAVQHFDEEEASPAFFAFADCKKLRPAFQPPDSLCWSFIRQFARHLYRAFRPLGRKTLATAVTASGENRAAALGSHARTETVTTLADKLGWLIGTLHLFKHRGVRPFLSFALKARSVVDYGERAWPANAGSMTGRARAYTDQGPGSQLYRRRFLEPGFLRTLRVPVIQPQAGILTTKLHFL
ncbi:hypothetical protein GGD50_003750 [Rhizobium paranaense]|uniref:Uncharacterized protein n=1 Tax=Rhizobium paranaense TaxID=1650438 RepID=A0A7W9D2Q9_9HYPH|nr:hypothetical protein [Rhizobium paranaense]